MARLNYRSEEVKDIVNQSILPKFLPDLSSNKFFVSKLQYFNFVASLVILKLAPPEYLRLVCNNNFFYNLENEVLKNYYAKIKKANNNRFRKNTNDNEEVVMDSSMQTTEIESEKAVLNSKDSTKLNDSLYYIMNLRRKYLTMAGLLINEQPNVFKEVFSLYPSTEQLDNFVKFITSLKFDPIKRNKDFEVFKDKMFRILDRFVPKKKFVVIDTKLPYGFIIGKKKKLFRFY